MPFLGKKLMSTSCQRTGHALNTRGDEPWSKHSAPSQNKSLEAPIAPPDEDAEKSFADWACEEEPATRADDMPIWSKSSPWGPGASQMPPTESEKTEQLLTSEMLMNITLDARRGLRPLREEYEESYFVKRTEMRPSQLGRYAAPPPDDHTTAAAPSDRVCLECGYVAHSQSERGDHCCCLFVSVCEDHDATFRFAPSGCRECGCAYCFCHERRSYCEHEPDTSLKTHGHCRSHFREPPVRR